MNEFKIEQGRIGDFILDQNNFKIPLTGLLFGRHHKLFNHTTSIQIKQIKPGYAEIFMFQKKRCQKKN